MDRGTAGETVRQLQRLLNSLGVQPRLQVDGRFGARTETAVRAVQSQLGLTASGVVSVSDRQRMQQRLAEAGAPQPVVIPTRASPPPNAGLGSLLFASAIMRGETDPSTLLRTLGAPTRRPFAWPVPGGVPLPSRLAGYVRHGTLSHRPHKGIDIMAPRGSPVVAVEDGVVLFARRGDNGGYGNMVILLHPDGACTRYAHLDTLADLQPGQRVVRGADLATVGSTGLSRGPHLHFEIWQDGEWSSQRQRFSAETLRANGATDAVIASMT